MLTVRDSNPGGMLKTTVSKAAADESTGGVALGYVEDAFKARTKLADVFSIPLKKRPALVWYTEAAIQPEWDPAILQSLKADCSAPPSSSGLTSTAVPSGTDD